MRSLLLVTALQLVTLKVPAPLATTMWLITFDRTASLANTTFRKLPEWNREAILPVLAPGDTVSLMFVDHEPRGRIPDPITRVFDTRTRWFVRQVLDIDEVIRTQQQAARTSQTDLGVVWRDLRRSVELDTAANAKHTYVLVALTDGKPDGPQTPTDTARPLANNVDYRIVVVGVDDGTEPGLRQMATQAGFADPARMLVVPRALADQSVPTIRQFLGRRVNPTVVQALKRGSRRQPVKR